MLSKQVTPFHAPLLFLHRLNLRQLQGRLRVRAADAAQHIQRLLWLARTEQEAGRFGLHPQTGREFRVSAGTSHGKASQTHHKQHAQNLSPGGNDRQENHEAPVAARRQCSADCQRNQNAEGDGQLVEHDKAAPVA